MRRWRESWRMSSGLQIKTCRKTQKYSCTTALLFFPSTWTHPYESSRVKSTGCVRFEKIMLQNWFMNCMSFVTGKILVWWSSVAIGMVRERNKDAQAPNKGTFWQGSAVRAWLQATFCSGNMCKESKYDFIRYIYFFRRWHLPLWRPTAISNPGFSSSISTPPIHRTDRKPLGLPTFSLHGLTCQRSRQTIKDTTGFRLHLLRAST